MLLDESARGVFVITPTPFTEARALDLASTDRMIEGFLAAGAAGFTILGIMGEAPKLEAAEALEFARRVLRRVDGRVPVIVGVSAPGFASMRALARGAMEAGAAGVMIAPPGGQRGDDAVIAYMAQASEAVAPAPYVLQDYPQATGTFISRSG
ncbi:dihydrodipicolinate synthase family protein [Siccirubricoccus phaeus]|nr:dihydrodipicolinate synthase family protein [Siccirubricoccus phaeus]